MSIEYVASAEAVEDDPLLSGLIVEHYRVDPGRLVIKALGWGALVIVVGMFVVASGLHVSRAISPLRVPSPIPPRMARYAGGPVDATGTPIDRSEEIAVQLGFGAAGLLIIISGGAIVLLGLKRELGHEVYLAFRTDGAIFRSGRHIAAVRWEDVEDVWWDSTEAAVCFMAHDGEVWARRERFAGVDGPELAQRACQVRRKALFGLYG
ncbi:MAG: hypothetical protein AB8I08_30915 [Sandaracinaceae bacterium]